MALLKQLKLGELTLPSNIMYSPLAGCSDFSYRQMASLYSPGLMFCEMVKMDALVRFDQNTFRLLDFARGPSPIGAQICGSKPEIAGKSAKIIEELGFDVVDLNCGCPVDKVTKDGSGSGLLRNPEIIGEIISNMVNSVSIPVTVKIRAGWDDENINGPEIVKIAEQAGAKVIFVHGRTRMQKYKGPSNWDHIKDCKASANTILVVGNGDVLDGPSAKKMLEETGCDGVLVSRGTLGKPWIAEEIRRFLAHEAPLQLTGSYLKDVFLAHFNSIVSYRSERRAVLELRKVGCWYLKGASGTKALRDAINKSKSLLEIKQLIDTFSWESLCSIS